MRLLVVACWATLAEASAEYAWQGALTHDSVVVKAFLNDASDLVLKLPERRRVAPVSENPFEFEVSGLAPSTKYEWEVGSLKGSFVTMPEPYQHVEDVKFAFASCADNDSNSKVFEDIYFEEPLFFVHTGDLHYGNLEQDSELEFRKMYQRSLTRPNPKRLWLSTPIAYVWDDHDFGPNNSDKFSPSKRASIASYLQCVPHYSISAPNIAQTFVVGKARFVMFDLSSEKEWGATALGDAQKAWFLNELLPKAAAEFASNKIDLLFLVSSMPWIDDYAKWGEFPHERAEIASRILKAGIPSKAVVVLSGDAHMLAVDDGSHSEGNFVTLQAAAIDAKPTTKGGPYSHGIWPGRGQFGVLTLKSNGCYLFEGKSRRDGGELKTVVEFDNCARTPSTGAYVPSPWVARRAWKMLKKHLSKHWLGVEIMVRVDYLRFGVTYSQMIGVLMLPLVSVVLLNERRFRN